MIDGRECARMREGAREGLVRAWPRQEEVDRGLKLVMERVRREGGREGGREGERISLHCLLYSPTHLSFPRSSFSIHHA